MLKHIIYIVYVDNIIIYGPDTKSTNREIIEIGVSKDE